MSKIVPAKTHVHVSRREDTMLGVRIGAIVKTPIGARLAFAFLRGVTACRENGVGGAR